MKDNTRKQMLCFRKGLRSLGWQATCLQKNDGEVEAVEEIQQNDQEEVYRDGQRAPFASGRSRARCSARGVYDLVLRG